MNKIILNINEQVFSKYLGNRRWEYNRTRHVTNKKIGPQSDEQIEIDGAGGEVSFCKHFNLYPDFDTEHYPYFDAILHNGLRVDVKQTRRVDGHLLVATWKLENPPDVYALVIGYLPEYNYIGMMLAEDVLKAENIKNFGYRDTYAVRQELLHYMVERKI